MLAIQCLRVNFGPGEKSIKHSHPACVVINLTEQHSHHGDADGSHRVVKGKVGEVHYFDAVEHISENKGDLVKSVKVSRTSVDNFLLRL